jgi:hypothetical protein
VRRLFLEERTMQAQTTTPVRYDEAGPVLRALYHSRHSVDGTLYARSELVDLVRRIEAACAERGLILSRWQTNKPNFHSDVTYAAHEWYYDRAPQFRYQKGVKAWERFTNDEGRTSRCKAYRILAGLLAEIEQLPKV